MSEKVMRGWVVKYLMPLNAVAVENPALPGTPDVNTVLGWIELKHISRPPVRPTTVVRLPHYTQMQRLWAMQRIRAGGMCLLLLQVGSMHILLDGLVAAIHLNHATLEELVKVSAFSWNNRPEPKELLAAVMACYRPWDHSNLRRVSI